MSDYKTFTSQDLLKERLDKEVEEHESNTN